MAKASTPGIRRLEWAGVATFAVLEVWLVARLAPGARAAPWLALIAVVLAYLTADLACGLVHWAADTWGPPDLPVVGRAFLRPFREHHLDPLAITRHDFADTNGNSCLVCLPVLGLALWLAPGGDGPGNVFLPAFLGALVWWAMLTNEFHKWAHLSDPGRVVALLQRLHLILTPANHAHHHIPPFNSHYCITLGWMNRPLARARFFARLEWFITRCTGVRPRREEMGTPAAAGVSAKILPLPAPRPVPPPVRRPGGATLPPAVHVGGTIASWQMHNHPGVPSNDHAEIADVLYRFAAGLDQHDRPLLASALSNDATVDFRAPAHRLGTTLPLFEGRRAITDALITSTARLDTTHSITNQRVTAYDGNQATVSALVEEHYQRKVDCRLGLVLMNLYTVDLSKEDRGWVITHMKVDNIRVTGDEAILWLPLVIAKRTVRADRLSLPLRSMAG